MSKTLTVAFSQNIIAHKIRIKPAVHEKYTCPVKEMHE